MRYLYFLFLFGLLAPTALLAQEWAIKGSIVSDKGQIIPYATIRLKQAHKGVASNQQGWFSFKMTPENANDTLVFSSVGYIETSLPVASAKSNEELKIVLAEETYTLDTASVVGKGLVNMVKKAIENMDENFQLKPYTYPAFYRQYHLENEQCVRLIEAAFDVYDPGFAHTTSAIQSEKLNLLALRRSNKYELNNAEHGNHLQDLLAENAAHYRIGTVLNENAITFFKFYRQGSDDVGSDIKRINYTYNNPDDQKIHKGTIWLKGGNFLIFRIEESTYPNPDYSGSWLRNTAGFDWVFREGKKVLQYKEVAGKMYLDSMSYNYKHDLIHPTFHSIDFTVEEYFQWWCGEPVPKDENYSPSKDYKKSFDLYLKKYQNNPVFWASNGLLLKHPFAAQLQKDLEWKLPLAEQFLMNGVD